MRRDAHQNIVMLDLGIFHEHIEVTVVIENARVQQLIFRQAALGPAPRILGDDFVVGKSALRIFVKHLEIGMRRRGIKVII